MLEECGAFGKLQGLLIPFQSLPWSSWLACWVGSDHGLGHLAAVPAVSSAAMTHAGFLWAGLAYQVLLLASQTLPSLCSGATWPLSSVFLSLEKALGALGCFSYHTRAKLPLLAHAVPFISPTWEHMEGWCENIQDNLLLGIASSKRCFLSTHIFYADDLFCKQRDN